MCSYSLTGHSSLILLRPPIALRHNSIEIRPINDTTMASECSSKRESCTSLTSNQKLETIKLSEEGMLKAKIGQKIGLCCQTVSQVANTKEKFSKEIKSVTPVYTGIVRMWNSLLAHLEEVLVVCVDNQTSHNISLSQGLIQDKALTLFSSTKAGLEEVRKLEKKSWKLAKQ